MRGEGRGGGLDGKLLSEERCSEKVAPLTATRAADLDVQGSDADLLAALCHVLGGQHSCVGGALVTVRLHLHATSHAGNGLTARDVRDVHCFGGGG